MSDIESKLEAVDRRFRKGTKQYKAARYIVRQNREISKEEKEKLCQEVPMAKGTLADLMTELRKLGLYPPEESSDIPKETLNTEIPQNTVPHTPEEEPSMQEYVTKEDFDAKMNLINSNILNLSAVIGGEPTSNPGNPVEYEEEIELIQPQEMEVIQPQEGFIQDPSLNRHTIWLKPKTSMYFDMARQGIFSNYADSRELGPFTQFNGNLSDFFNLIVDDYFIRNYNADIGLLMRRYVR